jgi:hypothetical protein
MAGKIEDWQLLAQRTMAPRFLTILTGRNLPKIRQPGEPEPSTINEKTVSDFTLMVEETGIRDRDQTAKPTPPPAREPSDKR